MTDTTTSGAHSAIRVLAALAELGETTAAAIAEHVGIAYSTTTPKLRAWENTGQAERFRTDDGHTLWRLTAAGRAATAIAEPHTAAEAASPSEPADQPEPATGTEPRTDTEAMPAAPQKSTDTGTPADARADDAVGSHAGGRAEPDTTSPTVDSQQPADNATDPGDSPSQTSTADLPDVDTADHHEQSAAAAPQLDATAEAGEPTDADTTTAVRRAPGSMRAAVLDICEAHPARQYKVSEICRLIDASNAGTDAKKASQGAVYNACTKLAAAGTLTQTVDRPATFQLTPTSN